MGGSICADFALQWWGVLQVTALCVVTLDAATGHASAQPPDQAQGKVETVFKVQSRVMEGADQGPVAAAETGQAGRPHGGTIKPGKLLY